VQLVSFGPRGAERPGVLLGDDVVDLRACDPSLPPTWRGILAQGRLDDARRAIDAVPPGDARILPRAGTRLGPPIPDPSKIVCIGLNYADHAAEQHKTLPETPLLFAKAPSALAGTGDPIVLPAIEPRVDIEAELAFVVGRTARHVRAADAYAYVAGYMCFDDVSGRLAQYDDKQWFRGKSFDTFAPCGPYLLTRDELPDPHRLAIGSRVGNRIMQASNTQQLVHGIPQLLEYITRSMTLVPGDIVATGTPAGVGVFRDPPLFLQAGDVVTVEIERLGALVNPVVASGVDQEFGSAGIGPGTPGLR
jgi:2-keto-4-pentenoate hydratase/2-oxohepta-3-ene-1,7-dioic acid hydratase in catechol pathway